MTQLIANTPRPAHRGIKRLILGVMVAVGATLTLTAWAQPHGGPGMFMGHPEHMGRMLDHMLDSVSATDAQRTQIKQIAQAAATDMKAQHEAGKALRERAAQLFTQPSVDANAAEALRQQMLQQHDQVTRRAMLAMLDVSRVLTPEQRTKLAERMNKGRDMMERHRRERSEMAPPKG